ncbi:Phosphoribosylformylglycinamidine synthase subunit PurQ [Trichinella spiralis]|uniref:Phosphoribosylformylglycinamidine synthase subunit PurQ n=1 Tax=Trichinella spiralis TaxID=6334 RepID=A0ABR3KKQ0_TRISP
MRLNLLNYGKAWCSRNSGFVVQFQMSESPLNLVDTGTPVKNPMQIAITKNNIVSIPSQHKNIGHKQLAEVDADV